MREKRVWSVYLLKCKDNSYYTGISKNVEKRIKTHQSGNGSRYVKSRGFSQLIGSKSNFTLSDALKTEYKIKQLSKGEKLKFFS